MDHSSKQTALFFGFLTAAMTAASAQAAPRPQPAPAPVVERAAKPVPATTSRAEAAIRRAAADVKASRG